jgi:hypothetical protein
MNCSCSCQQVCLDILWSHQAYFETRYQPAITQLDHPQKNGGLRRPRQPGFRDIRLDVPLTNSRPLLDLVIHIQATKFEPCIQRDFFRFRRC